jgi:hypothetical protein
VLIQTGAELLNFSKGEEDQLEAAIRAIAESGVRVLVTGSGIGEMALHFINRYNLLAIKARVGAVGTRWRGGLGLCAYGWACDGTVWLSAY